MKNVVIAVALTILVILVAGAIIASAGAYNVAADEPHSGLMFGILETARDRSIATRADAIEVPKLEDPSMARRGAGNYDAMCVGCHLAPGRSETELSVGLYPAPPNLAKHAHTDAAEAFWIIKHGIKATGMPAWGKRMEDEYIWDLVAFVRKLPTLSAEQYAAEVAASGGHSHGGGESGGHSHEESEHSHEASDESSEASDHGHDEGGHDHDEASESGQTHTHADGSEHTHAATGPVNAVKALHEAMSAGDSARVESLLDPKVLIMEGGSVERSRAEYASHHLPADLKFLKGTTYKLERQTGDTLGDLAWVASEARIQGSREGKPIYVISTESLVLKKSAAGWKVVHVHWSSRNAAK